MESLKSACFFRNGQFTKKEEKGLLSTEFVKQRRKLIVGSVFQKLKIRLRS